MIKDMELVKQNIINATQILYNPDNETIYLIWGDTNEIFIYVTNEDDGDITFHKKGTFDKVYPEDVLKEMANANSILEKNKLFKKLEAHEFVINDEDI